MRNPLVVTESNIGFLTIPDPGLYMDPVGRYSSESLGRDKFKPNFSFCS